MPTYCYTSKNGKTIEEVFPVGKAPSTIKRDGVRYARDIGAEHVGHRNTPGNWPMVNDMGDFCCHPSERVQLMQKLEAAGVPTYVNQNGDCVMESRAHRKKLCQVYGVYDKAGGYSDAQPR